MEHAVELERRRTREGEEGKTNILNGQFLYHNTSFLLHLLSPLGLQTLLERGVEHVMHALTCFGAAFHVFRADLLRNNLPLFGRHGVLTLCTEHPARLLVFSKINLGAYEEKRGSFAEMRDFGIPLFTETQPERSNQPLALCSSPSENNFRKPRQ